MSTPELKEKLSPSIDLSPKKVVMVLAYRDFRDEEYFVPREILEKAGVKIEVASSKKGIAQGAEGGGIEIDFEISEVDPSDFSGVVFVGGPGCLKYLDNPQSYGLVKETIGQGKVLGAICISPVILAKAGVLEDRKATVWSSPMDKSAVKILEQKGAIYQKEAVVKDRNIITASGPSGAKQFGRALVKALR